MLSHLWVNRERSPVLSTRWFKAWAKRVVTFPRLIGSAGKQSMLRLQGARIGKGVFIAPCKYNGTKSNLNLADSCFIGRVTFHLHDRIDIGRNVVINDGVILFTASHDVNSERFRTTTKPITIGDYAWIASNAIVLPGSTIGVGAVVGAGAVVRGNVPDFAIAIGNPATLIDRTRTRNLDYNPAALTAIFGAWLGNRN